MRLSLRVSLPIRPYRDRCTRRGIHYSVPSSCELLLPLLQSKQAGQVLDPQLGRLEAARPVGPHRLPPPTHHRPDRPPRARTSLMHTQTGTTPPRTHDRGRAGTRGSSGTDAHAPTLTHASAQAHRHRWDTRADVPGREAGLGGWGGVGRPDLPARSRRGVGGFGQCRTETGENTCEAGGGEAVFLG